MYIPKNNLLRLFACLLMLFCVSAAIFGQRAKQGGFKQLAGPSDELNAMRLPDPAALGTRSKTAMIPFRGTDSLIQIPIERSGDLKVLLISPDSGDLEISIGMQGEALLESAADGGTETTFGFDGSRFPAKAYSLSAERAGKMDVVIRNTGSLRDPHNAKGFIVVSSDSPYQAYSYINKLNTTTGSEISFISSIFDRTKNSDLEIPAALSGAISGGDITITMPSGKASHIQMGSETEGSFRGSFIPDIAGKYTAQITIRGINPEGEEFLRTSEHTFQVEKGASIGRNAEARLSDDLRWRIELPVEGIGPGQKVITHAEVWGSDENGNEQSIGWIGGMALSERTGKSSMSIPLNLDSRWLLRSEMKSYELRNVRIQNPDSLVVLDEATNIPLPGIYPSKSAIDSFNGEITEEMRVGKRPAIIASDAVGGKLMLVHGYCSGDAWPQTAQFTNFVKFLDLNRNRTHDQFANLIKNFGASLPSFGIVAHSQGGAASLHLYTYYWSGLDSATGTRLIQSVGTPYQGTALAGNLAVLGQVFGAGCGANNDLTYSGAASWLAGIPAWARAKVWYHTTSFTDVWWRYDYCSLATDLFLSDPEDGVVERSYAQLSGANNMGHKTGWCHTTSMRDPGQTTDSSRNSTMNANAAR